jgi:hypothetical protein
MRALTSIGIAFLALDLISTAVGCGGGGGGGSGSGNPTDSPGSGGKTGLLLEVDEIVPVLPSVTNPGDTTRFAVLLDARPGRPRPRFQWSLNGSPVDAPDAAAGGGEELHLETGSLEPGTYSVQAVASQGRRQATVSWQLQVPARPIENRPPVVIQAFPPGDLEIPYGRLARFHVVAGDVDAGDVPTHEWFVDGRRIPVDSPLLDVADLIEGSHAVRVVVSDGEAETSHAWDVKVVEGATGGRAHIAGAWPAGSLRIQRPGRLRFEVDIEAFGQEPPACLWEIDGVDARTSGPIFELDPSAPENALLTGAHRITCTLVPGDHDGAYSTSGVAWTLLLDPPLSLAPAGGPNTPPRAAAIVPDFDVAVLPGECHVFRADAFDADGDALTFAWFVDGVRQIADGPVFTYRAGEEIRQGRVSVELRATDGHRGQGSPPDYRLALWTLSLAERDHRGLGLAAGAVILDNGQSGTAASGYWPVSSAPSPYGSSSLYSKASGATYSYQGKLTAGRYEVLLWWTTWPGRATSVPVTIQHAGGTATVTVNQTVNGGRWNPIGTYDFGTSGKVTVKSVGSTVSTCADAVCFNPAGGSTTPSSASEIVIDDGTAGTSYEGSWSKSSAPDPYGTKSLYASVAGRRYHFSRAISAPATYDVYAWWTEWPSRERQVPYEITHQGGVAVVHRDQLSGGGQWNLLGRYTFGSGVKVSVRVPGTKSVCADAVRFVQATSTSPPPAPATTYSIQLAWDPPVKNADGTTLQDLAGFKLHWGTASRQYSQTVNVGTATTHTVGQLPAGTYYFAATAHDTLGNESAYSTEISATRP